MQLDPKLIDLNEPTLATNVNAIPANPSTLIGTQRDSNQQNNDMVRSNLHNSDPEVAHMFAEIEAMIQRILGMPALIKRNVANSFTDSPFVDKIALMEMPKKFNFPKLK